MEIQYNTFSYATLLQQVKKRVELAQKKQFMRPMKRCYQCTGILAKYCLKSKTNWMGE